MARRRGGARQELHQRHQRRNADQNENSARPAPAGAPPFDAAGQNARRCDDGQRTDAGQSRGRGCDSNAREKPRLHSGASQVPDGLCDDGDDHGLHSVENGRSLRQGSVTHICPGEEADQNRSGHNEAHAGNDETGPAGAQITNVDGHLGGAGARDEARCAEPVEELLAREPALSTHHLVLHHGDVRRRAAECRCAEAEKQPREFGEAGLHEAECRSKACFTLRFRGTRIADRCPRARR